MEKLRILSGIQPSGELHLGNYIGALQQFVALQNDYDCCILLVDLHAITVPQDPNQLRRQILHTANTYLACGLDPNKVVLFRQSDISAHAELAWLFNTIATMGELKRMTQFKNKSAGSQADSVGVGLFDYPVLMAADILLYQPDLVPVGDDQKQHVELARNLAQRFNHRFGSTFKVPEVKMRKAGARIMGLDDPTKKMSKSAASAANYVSLVDSPETIKKKIARAVTDSGKEIKATKGKPALTNLLTIYSLLSGTPVDTLESDYQGRSYAEFKADLAEVVIMHLTPIRERLLELDKDPAQTLKILRNGADQARPVAAETLAAAKQAMGLTL